MPSVLRVIVAGGGVAGLEALLALRDLAGDRVELVLLAPEDDFVFRPMAVTEPFSLGHRQRVPLADVARDVGAQRVRDGLASVDAAGRSLTTTGGETLRFDALVVATGARVEPALAHGLTWTPESDAEALGGLLRDIEEGYVKHVAFVIPPEPAWPLPAYELALMTAREGYEMGRNDLDVVVLTPETQPLGLFGTRAAAAVREQLEAGRVRVETGTYVADGGRAGVLRLDPGGRTLEVDRVVALPAIRGRAIEGLPADEGGFLRVDEHGRVQGAEHVWAAGDGTSFPVKQGGLATQQADAVAEAIAALAGAELEPRAFRPVLRGILLTGAGAQYMRHDAAGGAGEGETAAHALWWPPSKVGGRYLAPYLATLTDAEAVGLDQRPDGLPVELDLHH